VAMLSHEMGFMFGLIIAIFAIADAHTTRKKVHWSVYLIVVLTLLYPLVYRLVLPGLWTIESATTPLALINRISTNATYFMQGVAGWTLIVLRPFIGLTPDSPWIVAALFVCSVGLGLILLWRKNKLMIAIPALAWWSLILAPALLLTEDYVLYSPRLLYTSAIGVALFWGLVVITLLQSIKPLVVKGAVCVFCITLFAWCIPYITDRMNETARLTPAMISIDADLRRSDPVTRVLLINMPYWNGPAYPAFLLGVEGMPIFQSEDTPTWTWLAAVSGVRRETSYIRHDISLTYNEHFVYGIPGHTVNDLTLRQEILKNNLIYRFDYDVPGLRVTRLARIHQGSVTPNVTFMQGQSRASIQSANAQRCENGIHLNLEWGNVGGMPQPVAVFVHGYGSDGKQVLVADRDLMDGYLPLDQVPFGVVILETRLLSESASTVNELHIGVYNRVSGGRFSLSDAGGNPLASDELVVPVTEASGHCD
jgi:hypothetical protein